MDQDLSKLRINRSPQRDTGFSRGARWILMIVVCAALLGVAGFLYATLTQAPEVSTVRVKASTASSAGEGSVTLQATGYIVAAHKIQLASKVMGKVAWIGVEKGDRVKQGQILVRLEDDEYRARLLEAKGQLASLKARLAELEHGSRPEEKAKAEADLAQSKADL